MDQETQGGKKSFFEANIRALIALDLNSIDNTMHRYSKTLLGDNNDVSSCLEVEDGQEADQNGVNSQDNNDPQDQEQS